MKASRRMGGVVVFALVTALFCTFAVAGGASGQTDPRPPFLVAEEPAPATANIPCEPTTAHPYPVVLVHGTFEDAKQNWEVLSAELKNKGYCVFALNYGNRGLERIEGSARELDTFVDKVLAFTGAEKVQVVGHSQGGMMPRYWIKFLGGASKLEDLVGIAPSNYGTKLGNASSRDSDPRDFGLRGPRTSEPCYACEQQGAGSKFLQRLNAGDDTPGDGSYTNIATNDDEIIIPFRNCFLKGDARTINLIVQRYNNGAPVTHQNIYQDPYAKALVFDALDHRGTADPDRADFPPTP